MPELPEVETIKNDLQRFIVNKKITSIKIKDDFIKKIFPGKEKFVKSLKNEIVKNVKRRGKLLLIDFGQDIKLLIHLKMTGQLIYQDNKGYITFGGHPIGQDCQRPDRFNKVLFIFNDNSKLYFNDIRKFGYLKLVDDEEATKQWEKYGYEPLDKDFTFKKFNEILIRKQNQVIKKVLLQQDLIAGIGNIYADEACFGAGILPDKKIQKINPEKRLMLFKELKRIIKKSIKHRGTSFSDYRDCSGKQGNYVKFLKVYGRAGQTCLKCRKTKIMKNIVASRGTSYCPFCQK